MAPLAVCPHTANDKGMHCLYVVRGGETYRADTHIYSKDEKHSSSSSSCFPKRRGADFVVEK